MVYRVYVEKKAGQTHEADSLLKEVQEFLQISGELGLSVLTEIHDEREAETALSAGARIVGVNNRNLKDFTVDVDNSVRLRRLCPEETIFVSESGIRTSEDIQRLRDNRVDAVLIGESLMRSPNKKAMLETLNGGPLRG